MKGLLIATSTLLAGLLMILSTACDSTLREAQTELDRHRALWTSNRPDDYSFVVTDWCHVSCLGVPVTIRVENRVIASMKYVKSGKAYEYYSTVHGSVTIDRLFDRIQEAIDVKASEIKAIYDPEIGYPTDVTIDYDSSSTDSTNGFTVSGYSSGGQR